MCAVALTRMLFFWSFLPRDGNISNKFLFWNVETGVYQIAFRIKLPSLPLPRFPLITSCYKIVDSQTSFTLCLGFGVACGKFWKGRSRCRKFWKGRSWSWSQIFYLWLRNRGYWSSKTFVEWLGLIVQIYYLMLFGVWTFFCDLTFNERNLTKKSFNGKMLFKEIVQLHKFQ